MLRQDFRDIAYDALAMGLQSEGLSNADSRKLKRLRDAFGTRGVWAGATLDIAYEAQLQWMDETRAPFSVRLIGTVWLAITWQKESMRPGRPKGSNFPSRLADRLARAYLSITREHPPTTDPYAATREHPYHHLVRETFKRAGVLPGWQRHTRAAARRIRGENCGRRRPN
jgi:hypothetical protein